MLTNCLVETPEQTHAWSVETLFTDPWWIYIYRVCIYIYIYINKTINSPWYNSEAVREISIYISMWLCYYNIEEDPLLLSILTVCLHNLLDFVCHSSLPHSPGWLSRCPLTGTSETSLSSHTSSRSCPCSRFAHYQESEGGRVDWENTRINLLLESFQSIVGEWVTRKRAKPTWGSWDLLSSQTAVHTVALITTISLLHAFFFLMSSRQKTLKDPSTHSGAENSKTWVLLTEWHDNTRPITSFYPLFHFLTPRSANSKSSNRLAL